MENYYVTAVITRPMGAAEAKQISVAGRIYVGRVKTIVLASSPAEAIAAGSEDFRNALAKSGLHISDLGCIPVELAAEIGDTEIYARYPTADELARSLLAKEVLREG